VKFDFPNKEQQIVYPKNFIYTFASYFQDQTQDDASLLCKASAIGHIPSIKRILLKYDYDQRARLIK
jgi:hypothetical protein